MARRLEVYNFDGPMVYNISPRWDCTLLGNDYFSKSQYQGQ